MPKALIDGKAPGQRPKLYESQRQELARIVESGPVPAVHGVIRWRLVDLVRWIFEAFGITISERTLSRTLRAGATASFPPGRATMPRRQANGQKNFPTLLEEIARQEGAGVRIEVWFQDEARIGQKNKITRRWAKRGTRPSAPHDQRTRSAHIFGAICPHEAKGAGLVLPSCNTAAMNLHLTEISQAVAPGAYAVLLMDQAGWHTSTKLVVPDNMTVVSLPVRSPELCTKWTRSGNPVENVWQFMRDNWLSNRIFTSYEDVIGHCCHAWNTLIDQPWKIMSIGRRQWAHRS